MSPGDVVTLSEGAFALVLLVAALAGAVVGLILGLLQASKEKKGRG